MKKRVLFYCILLSISSLFAQKVTQVDRPKLVVGIVVDQMRYDYLTRFYNHYGNDGFKRLLNEGFNVENGHFNYIPTYTAVGHASVYTGTTPDTHGIIGNNWFDKFKRQSIYCVDDDRYKTIGAEHGGKKSPYRLVTTTITDQLRLSQQMKGKTISMSIKDRSAVLPGGHTANAAYWFQGKDDGKFISSTYYMKELPDWVKKFNNSKVAKTYLKQKWTTLKNIKSYTESIEDNNNFEEPFKGMDKAVFPYDLSKLAKKNGSYDMIKNTPFGNSILVDFAKAAIKAEKLGQTGYTDFLAISFSSPDYIGHRFGVDSKEVQDNYLRLDADIAQLLEYLDKEVGKDEYTLFLTADHAAVPVPSYLQSQKIPAQYLDKKAFRKFLDDKLKSRYHAEGIIENISNFQVFLNPDVLNQNKLDKQTVSEYLVEEIINYKAIFKAVTAKTMQNTEFTSGILAHLQQGYNQKISGDILIVPNPATISYSKKGSTHGSGFNYDTHVPIMFYGKGIKKGSSKNYTRIIDITPTIANLLQIAFPNGSKGQVVEEALE